MGVKGRLRDMSLVDIVYILHAERKTAAIHLASDKGYGIVFIQEGEIIHASHRQLKGVEAVYQFLTWKDGEFELEPNPVLPARTIDTPVESLLLEGLKRLDEAKAEKAQITAFPGDQESVQLLEKLLDLGIIEKAGGRGDAG